MGRKQFTKLANIFRASNVVMRSALSNGCLQFDIIAECPVTKARFSRMTLPHGVVETPVFMPVGTQGTLKGLLPEQVSSLEYRLMLGNTYHLGHRPVIPIIAMICRHNL